MQHLDRKIALRKNNHNVHSWLNATYVYSVKNLNDLTLSCVHKRLRDMRMSLPGFWPRPRRGWPLYRTPSVSWRISYWLDPSTGWWVFLEGNHGWKWLLGEKKSVIKYDNFKKKGKEILLYIRVFFTNFERKKLPSIHFFTILCDKCCLHELTNTLIIHFFVFMHLNSIDCPFEYLNSLGFILFHKEF